MANEQQLNEQQQWIEELAKLPAEDAAKRIHEKMQGQLGYLGEAFVKDAEHKIVDLVDQFKKEHALHVTGFADVLVRNKVAANVNIDKEGQTSYGVSGQMSTGKLGNVSLFAGGSVGFNESGVTGGSAWLNGIGKPFDFAGAHIVPVSQVAVNIPKDGKMGLGNVTGMVGAVINPDGTHGNIAALGSASLDGKSANVFVDYSHDFQYKDWNITPNFGLTQQLLGDRGTGISGGARVHNSNFFDKSTGLAFEVSAGVGNVRAKDPAWSVGVQAEVTFGNAPKEAKTSDLDEALSKYQKRDYAPKGLVNEADQSKAVDNSQPLLAAHRANQSKVDSDLNYNFLELNRKDQQKVLNMMASAFKKEHPDLTLREARTELLDRLAASNYFVNAHGTSSYRDDTVLENTQVVSR